ncbi:MAG: hypothetical protein IJ231_09965 [Clostridia bacterium]|nr:hypothetical protein [Clostridia bacterium]
MKKIIALILALCICCAMALAELEEPVEETQVTELLTESVEAPETEPAAEPAAEQTEAPVAENAPERTEAPTAEPTPEQTEKPAAEKTAEPASQPTAGLTETPTEQSAAEQENTTAETAQPEEDAPRTEGRLKLDQLEKCELSGSVPERTWEWTVSRKATFLLTTEDMAAKVIVRSLDGEKVWEREPETRDGRYLPLNEEVTMLKGSYLITFARMEEQSGDLTWMVSRKPEETEGSEETAAEEPGDQESLPENLPGADEEQNPPVSDAESYAPAEDTESTEHSTPVIQLELEETEQQDEDSVEIEEIGIDEEDGEEADPLSGEEDPADAEQAPEADSDAPGEEDVTQNSLQEAQPENGNAEAAEETEPAEASQVTVRLSSNVQDLETIYPGMEATIHAEVTGADRPYTLQWQYSPDGGQTIVDVEDADAADFHYTVDEETVHYLWRVVVRFDETETPAETAEEPVT